MRDPSPACVPRSSLGYTHTHDRNQSPRRALTQFKYISYSKKNDGPDRGRRSVQAAALSHVQRVVPCIRVSVPASARTRVCCDCRSFLLVRLYKMTCARMFLGRVWRAADAAAAAAAVTVIVALENMPSLRNRKIKPDCKHTHTRVCVCLRTHAGYKSWGIQLYSWCVCVLCVYACDRWAVEVLCVLCVRCVCVHTCVDFCFFPQANPQNATRAAAGTRSAASPGATRQRNEQIHQTPSSLRRVFSSIIIQPCGGVSGGGGGGRCGVHALFIVRLLAACAYVNVSARGLIACVCA